MKKHEYYGFSGWNKGDDYDTVAKQFSTILGREPDFVYAVYSTPAYEGNATIIYRQGAKWFESTGCHCSCYGLEGQWEPHEIDPTVHLRALQNGRKELLVADTEGDYPEATQEHFDRWLAWVMSRT